MLIKNQNNTLNENILFPCYLSVFYHQHILTLYKSQKISLPDIGVYLYNVFKDNEDNVFIEYDTRDLAICLCMYAFTNKIWIQKFHLKQQAQQAITAMKKVYNNRSSELGREQTPNYNHGYNPSLYSPTTKST